MEVTKTRRIVLIGETGSGKSSLANTIFGENDVFKISHTFNSETRECRAETRSVNGRSITLIDTPGLFDTHMSEENLKPEIMRCITECAPGPHAFLILLKVNKFSMDERVFFKKICECFSEEAFKYAAVVFTHGDLLEEGMTIEEYVNKRKHLSDLVKKCGGRCHVIDNKHWKNKQQDEYRSNQFQVAELLNTIDNIVMENKGVVAVEVAVGAAGGATVTTGLVVGGVAAAGAAVGGFIGYHEADQADSVAEAVENTAKSIWDIIAT